MPSSTNVHIVRAPWKEALIRLLEPWSPLEPWQPAATIPAGDAVVLLLDTDPVSVLASVGLVKNEGDVAGAFDAIKEYRRKGLLELGTLNMLADFSIGLDDDTVYYSTSLDGVLETIGACGPSSIDALFGHTTLAHGRVLLASRGRCAGCDRPLDLLSKDAADHVHIHTVTEFRWTDDPDFTGDWPAALCDSCAEVLPLFGDSFLEYRFFLNGACPDCGAYRARNTMYGMPVRRIEEPWIAAMGCVRKPWDLVCLACDHEWVSG